MVDQPPGISVSQFCLSQLRVIIIIIIIIIIIVIVIIIIVLTLMTGAFISIFQNQLKAPQGRKLWSLLPIRGAT